MPRESLEIDATCIASARTTLRFIAAETLAQALQAHFAATRTGIHQTTEKTTMKPRSLWILLAPGLLAAAAACHRAEPPSTVQNDVAKAQERAAEGEAKANQKAAETVASESQQAGSKEASAAYDVAIAKADGDYKIARANCEALAGDAQKACVDRAEAARAMAKAKAESAKARYP
jgi:hypothetical protein